MGSVLSVYPALSYEKSLALSRWCNPPQHPGMEINLSILAILTCVWICKRRNEWKPSRSCRDISVEHLCVDAWKLPDHSWVCVWAFRLINMDTVDTACFCCLPGLIKSNWCTWRTRDNSEKSTLSHLRHRWTSVNNMLDMLFSGSLSQTWAQTVQGSSSVTPSQIWKPYTSLPIMF